jgi:hypothetical protein
MYIYLMVDIPEGVDGLPLVPQESVTPNETQEQERNNAWQEYLNKYTPNSQLMIEQVMRDSEVQPWVKIKAMDSLLAPATHPDFKPFSGIDAHMYDSVERFRSWIEYVGAEEAHYMAGKIPEYIQNVEEAIDAEPTNTSYKSLTLQEKLSHYYEMIPTVVRKIQDIDPEAAERLFTLMVTIDTENADDEGRVRSKHVMATFEDHLLQEKWKRMMANRIHKGIDALHGQENQQELIKEYAKIFDLLLGNIESGVEPPISKTFFEDEMQYLLEVGGQQSGIGLRHTLSALELLRGNKELARQFARGQILPQKELFWYVGQSDRYKPRDLVTIADMFPEDTELVEKIREFEADMNRREEQHRASMGEDEKILDRLKQP